jgi:hypothetical protein
MTTAIDRRGSAVTLRVLDLFSGLNGWTAPFRDHGHDVFSIDLDPRFDADAHVDISDVGAVLTVVPWRPDIVFASPPCNSFSTMTMGRMWTYGGEPKHPLAVEGRRLVLATLRIITVLQPTYWTIENPRARLRTLDLLAGIPRATISQCQYGTGRQKMTDLFGMLPPSLVLRPRCRNGASCHVPAPRGSRSGTQGGLSGVEAAKIPYDLANAFRVALERDALLER